MHQIETYRQRARSRVALYMDLFVAEMGSVPNTAHQVFEARELPPQLERLTATIHAPNAWRARAAGPRNWFLEGRHIDSTAPSAQQPTLILTFRDHDARADAAGVWRRTAPGRWERQQVLAEISISGKWHQVMRPLAAHRFSSSRREWHCPIK